MIIHKSGYAVWCKQGRSPSGVEVQIAFSGTSTPLGDRLLDSRCLAYPVRNRS